MLEIEIGWGGVYGRWSLSACVLPSLVVNADLKLTHFAVLASLLNLSKLENSFKIFFRMFQVPPINWCVASDQYSCTAFTPSFE
jgi:hypothetical protein